MLDSCCKLEWCVIRSHLSCDESDSSISKAIINRLWAITILDSCEIHIERLGRDFEVHKRVIICQPRNSSVKVNKSSCSIFKSHINSGKSCILQSSPSRIWKAIEHVSGILHVVNIFPLASRYLLYLKWRLPGCRGNLKANNKPTCVILNSNCTISENDSRRSISIVF